MKENGKFIVIGSGESYNTRIVSADQLFDALMELLFGNKANCEDLDYWKALISDDDNWQHDIDLGPVHFHTDIGETDHIDIYRIENEN